ncbi:tyrosine-type recombinase/integrase [Coleofasciculus sp. E1-EBD-02]|uniref:tyrosine-type recombinase/integrase n=1 Tax=Coleofasciculus sp. E1-EBD-02 TaxID=3068481 RepID=UPI0032FCF1B2
MNVASCGSWDSHNPNREISVQEDVTSVMDGSLSTSINDSWLSQSQDDLIFMLLQDKRSPQTRAAYKKDLRNFFFVVANTPEPTPQIVVEFLSLDRFAAVSLVLKYKAFLLEQGLMPATVNRRLAAVKSLVKFARKIGRCSYSLEDIEGERNRAYRDTTGIDIKAFKRVLMECDRSTKKGLRDYAILHLLWSNALRRSEVVNLDVKDFEPNNKTLTILGKGQASREVINISEATTQAILAWLNERNGVDPNAPLFVAVSYNKRGNRLTGEALRQLVCLYCKKAGISKQMSPHRIRHSSITHALDITGDVRKVQRLSRHVKLETLMIYDDNRQDIQGEVSELLSDALE